MYVFTERAIRFEKAIQHFASSHRDLRDFELTDSDWRNINQIAEWLTIFVAATTEMSATKSPMISTTHAVFRGLQDQLKNILTSLPDNVTPTVKSGILKAHRKLSDYFYKFDQSPYYTWAASKLYLVISVPPFFQLINPSSGSTYHLPRAQG